MPDATDAPPEDWRQQPYEPLLPIEKRLILGSLILGLLFLAVLLWVSATFFPVVGPPR